MAASPNSLQQQLLGFIASLPEDVNPYSALADYFQGAVVPRIPFSGLVQLILLLVVASMFVRYFKGIFWLFQISHSPTLIRPHFSLSWSSVSVVMLGLVEGYIFQCVKLFKREMRTSLGYWVCLVWVLGFIGGEFAAWSLAVSFLVHVEASGERGGSRKIERWAKVSNYVGILSPIVYLAVILPLAITTGRTFSSTISTYLEIDSLLRNGAASKNWTPGQALSILALAPALPLVEKLGSDREQLALRWRGTNSAYSVFSFILVASLMTIAVLYLTSLRRRIQQTARDLQGVQGSRGASKQVRLTYQTLQWTIGAFVLLGSVFVSVASYAAIVTNSLQAPVAGQILILGPLWALAVCGLPTSISLLWRAIDARSSESGESSTGPLSNSSRPRQFGKQYSIELNGRRRSDRAEVNVTVDVLVKEEGGPVELEKWESLSSTSKL
ncbi:uncharacterized protein JCM6883_005551 [Sporobolomyces salmoneus]|uniref:uncharacterized protein n=1 Tax=Sporobolomyces salmoneus TaxID=183962 RepID=UPI0031738297